MRHPFLQETINDHLNCLWKINPSTSTHWLCAIVCVCVCVCVCVRMHVCVSNLYDLRQTIPSPIQKTTDHLGGGQFIGFGLITDMEESISWFRTDQTFTPLSLNYRFQRPAYSRSMPHWQTEHTDQPVFLQPRPWWGHDWGWWLNSCDITMLQNPV